MNSRLHAPFLLRQDKIAQRHDVLLSWSGLLRSMSRSRVGEGRIRSSTAASAVLVLVWTIVLSRPLLSAGGLMIELKDEAFVSSSEVLLKDIADLRGTGAERLEELAELSVGPSPRFGLATFLNRYQIREIVQAAAGSIPESCFGGAHVVQIKLKGREIKPDEITTILKARLLDTGSFTNPEIEVLSVGDLENIELPPGEVTLRIPSRMIFGSGGNLVVPVEAVEGGRTIKSFWVRAEVRLRALLLVAARKIPFGKVISMEDLSEIRTGVTAPDARYVGKAEDIVGKVSRRVLMPGTPLLQEHFANPFLVRNGQIVHLRLERNGFVLSALARAEQNGRLGQVIYVRNIEFAKLLKAKVVGLAEVKLQ